VNVTEIIVPLECWSEWIRRTKLGKGYCWTVRSIWGGW